MEVHPADIIEARKLARSVGMVRVEGRMLECLVLLIAKVRAENRATADTAHHHQEITRKCGGWRVG